MRPVVSWRLVGPLCSALAAAAPPEWAQTIEQPRTVIGDNAAAENDTDLAKQIQNPVGDPMQDNANFGYGPHKGTQNVLNLQPVIPFHINDDRNLITRTILPIVWNAVRPTIGADWQLSTQLAFVFRSRWVAISERS